MAHPDLALADSWRRLEARLMGLEAGLARLDRRLDVLSGQMRALDMRLNTVQAHMEHQTRSQQGNLALPASAQPQPEPESPLLGEKKPRRSRKAEA